MILFSFSCDESSCEVAEGASTRVESIDFAGRQRVAHRLLRCPDLLRIEDKVADMHWDTIIVVPGDKDLN